MVNEDHISLVVKKSHLYMILDIYLTYNDVVMSNRLAFILD